MILLSNWLDEPSPGKRFPCSLGMKKTIFVLLSFILLLLLGIVQYIFIEKFDFIQPRILYGSLFLIEQITFLIFIFAFYPEKPKLLLPFIITEIVRIIVLSALIVYYIFLNIKNESNGTMTRAVGHLFFVLAAYIFIVSFAISAYQIFSNRGSSSYSSPPQPISNGHHIIVLEQPIEEAMYGKRSQQQ